MRDVMVAKRRGRVKGRTREFGAQNDEQTIMGNVQTRHYFLYKVNLTHREGEEGGRG